MHKIEAAKAERQRGEMVCRVETAGGAWVEISEADFERVVKCNGGYIQVTVHPDVTDCALPRNAIVRFCQDSPEGLEKRIAKAKTQIAALTEKLTALQKMLSEVA